MPQNISAVRFLTFTGRPGSGKGTIIKRLLEQESRLQIFRGRSLITRNPRTGDVPEEYEYTDEKTFEEIDRSGQLLWSFEHGTYRVGTRKKDVELALMDKDRVSIMTLVPEAVSKLEKFVGQGKLASFFIEAFNQKELLRMLKRGDDPSTARDRLDKTREWSQMRMIKFGVYPLWIPNPDDDPPGSTATNRITGYLQKMEII